MTWWQPIGPWSLELGPNKRQSKSSPSTSGSVSTLKIQWPPHNSNNTSTGFHIHWFSTKGLNVCPQDQILHDLKEQILEWWAEGDQVILLADMNEDVCQDPILPWSTHLGLTEAIMAHHNNRTPNTHNYGQNPIDGIFVPTEILSLIKSSYLAFGEGIPSNHQVVWIDVPILALGWFSTPTVVPLKARRLKCKILE